MSVEQTPDPTRDVASVQFSDPDLAAKARLSQMFDQAAAAAYAHGDSAAGDMFLDRADTLMAAVQDEYDRRHPEAAA